MASLSQGRTAAAQRSLFTYKSVPVIFEPPCIIYWKEVMASINYQFTSKSFVILSSLKGAKFRADDVFRKYTAGFRYVY